MEKNLIKYTKEMQERAKTNVFQLYGGADKSLARPTSRCILFDGENISFDASLVTHTHTHTHIYIYIYIYIYNKQNTSGSRSG